MTVTVGDLIAATACWERATETCIDALAEIAMLEPDEAVDAPGMAQQALCYAGASLEEMHARSDGATVIDASGAAQR
jgi:hypothetical protein